MNNWTIPPTYFAKETGEQHTAMVAKTAYEIHNKLVNKTPIDTGRAKSNWLPSHSQPETAATEDTSVQNAVSRAGIVFDPKRLPAFPVLFIANNLDYIAALNNGHSDQAPANFVEMAIREVVGNVI